MKKYYLRTFASSVVVGAFLVLAAGSRDSKSNNSTKASPTTTEEHFSVDQQQLNELNEYLQRGKWTCTNVESGTAPFMRGATFVFKNNKMIVSSQGTTVENKHEITAIMPNIPKSCKCSALITINNNKDMLTWIDEELMVLSWGGDKAKLRLQRTANTR